MGLWINSRLSQLWMNVYRNNGELMVRNNFAPTVIYELTAPSVPEAAREEAEEHERLLGNNFTTTEYKRLL